MTDDLISRQAAIEAVNTALFPKINTAKDAEKALSALPSAQPERKRGKWLKSYGDHEAFGVRPFYRYCSECNESTVWAYNFCPHCGAEMEG